MRTLPTQEALVAAYWRKLAIFNGAPHESRSRVSARRAARGLQARQRRASHSQTATELLRPRAQFHSNL
jgi:hypothetical protein